MPLQFYECVALIILKKRKKTTIFIMTSKIISDQNKKKWKNSKIRISKELRDIIHGYVMSDGYIRNGCLTVHQGEKQKAYVQWLYEKLKIIRTPKPIKEVIMTHSKTHRQSRSFRFFTRSVLHGFENMWYQVSIDTDGHRKLTKKLPKNIHCFFNETFVTVWFAGDGTKIIGSKGAKFEVTAFTVQERLTLKNLFFTKFGICAQIISSGLSKAGRPQWALKIPAQDYQKFRNIITKMDLIPNLFPYKLHKKT